MENPFGGRAAAWRTVKRVATALLIALAIGLLGVGVVVRTGHLSLEPVLSGSMQPTVSAGDVAVLWEVPTSSLKVGDVITFHPPGDTGTPKMHRIATLTRSAWETWITTKGDANRVADPWGKIVLKGTTAYQMVGLVPLVGWVAVAAGNVLPGFLLILAGLVLGLVAYRAWRKSAPSDSRIAAKETQS